MSLSCADVTRKLQPFLDDLLEEAEYQAMHEHLAYCSPCQRRIGAVGSLSWAVKGLGDVETPSDLVATTLFRLRQAPPPASAPEAAAAGAKTPWALVGVGVLVLALGVGGFLYAKHRKPEAPVTATAVITPKPGPSEQEAKQVIGELESILESLGGPPSGSGAQATREDPLPAAEEEEDAPEPPLVHWTVHLKAPRRTQVLDTIEGLHVTIEHESPELLLLAVPQNAVEALGERLSLVHDVTLDVEAVKLSRYGAGKPVRMGLHLLEEYVSP